MSFLQVIYHQIFRWMALMIQIYAVSRATGATLKFDVELVGINEAPPMDNVFKKIDLDQDNQLSKEEVI